MSANQDENVVDEITRNSLAQSDAMVGADVEQLQDPLGPDSPSPVARTRAHATIWGATGTWLLRLRVIFTPTPTEWVAARTVASTW